VPPACFGAGERRLVLKSESDWQLWHACLWSISIHVAGRRHNVARRTEELRARGGEGM
jgi:hypothetical protein